MIITWFDSYAYETRQTNNQNICIYSKINAKYPVSQKLILTVLITTEINAIVSVHKPFYNMHNITRICFTKHSDDWEYVTRNQICTVQRSN